VTRIKLGVLANEFFDPALGRMGGFGWAARQVARCFQDPGLGVDVVYLTGELRAAPGQRETVVHGRRLLLRQPSALANFRQIQAERPDLLLTIDYRPPYRPVCLALMRTPMIVWVHDPRPPEDVAQVNTVRIPGAPSARPRGTYQPDCSSLGPIVRLSRRLGRSVVFAGHAPHMRDKFARVIGMEVNEFDFLPDPVDLQPGAVRKSERPRVVFLGRLDSVKRPWLFAELGRHFPAVEFQLAGQANDRGEGTWEPDMLAPNVRLLGHIDGPDKVRVLSSAWVLVNTSIHEGLPVSFLEALACETPLLACVDPGGLTSEFGLYTGRCDGIGFGAVPGLAAGLERLLADADLRARLGKAGRRWVEATHSPAHFRESFRELCVRAGVPR